MTASYIPVSVIILTQDEEINIRACLESVAWSDDVILVDSGSRDKTLIAAKTERPDVRIFSHPFQDFGDQRNWALDHTNPKNDWILFVDADERIPPACATAIGAVVRQSALRQGSGQAIRPSTALGAGSPLPTDKSAVGGSALRNPQSEIVEPVGYYLSPRNYFLGRWIKHCSLYPSWQLRLLKKGHVRFRKEGHGQREVTEGPLGYVHEPYDHFGFSKGIAEWVDRHNAYSTNETELILRLRGEPLKLKELFGKDPVTRRRCLKRLAARAPCRALARFLYLYLFRGGFLDGRAGLTFCMLRMGHEINLTAKLAEARLRISALSNPEPRTGNREPAALRNRIKWLLFPGINLHARLRYRVLPRFFGSARRGEDRDVLDAGCGNGMLSYQAYRRGNHVLGITLKENEAVRNERRFGALLGIPGKHLSFRVQNLYAVEELGAFFDEVICSEVLEHITRDAAVCRSFAKILKPGGVLHLCCPNAAHPDNASKPLDTAEQGGHVRPGYTLDSYKALLEPLGFRIMDSAGLGGPIRQRFNRRIIAAQEKGQHLLAYALFAAGFLLSEFDPRNPPVPYSLYVRAVKTAS